MQITTIMFGLSHWTILYLIVTGVTVTIMTCSVLGLLYKVLHLVHKCTSFLLQVEEACGMVASYSVILFIHICMQYVHTGMCLIVCCKVVGTALYSVIVLLI